MFLEYLFLEIFLIFVAGLSLFWGKKGMYFSLGIISIINFIANINYLDSFWFWEIIILLFAFFGIIMSLIFDKKTNRLRMIKVTIGSMSTFIFFGILLPLLPALTLWSLFIGIPLLFTYRKIPKYLYPQIIFKFIFSSGWIIIGNILY